MLLLIASSLIIATLSQTWIIWNEEEAMVIKNVIYQNANQITDLVIPSNQKGKEFKFVINDQDTSIGKYKTHNKEVLEFSKKSPYSAYTFEEEIQKKKVKYNDVIIKPTFSYMISAHGAEFRNIHNRQQDTRQAWNHASDLSFFVPSYTSLKISDGEKLTKWFESGQFVKLKKWAEEKGEIVSRVHRNYQNIRQHSTRVNEHYAGYGTEFEISSGVYRMIRETGNWRVEQMALIPNRKQNGKPMMVLLFDIVTNLERLYGPGQFYWNACRDDKTVSVGSRPPTDYADYPILTFQDIYKVKTPYQLKTWRSKQRDKCIKNWRATKKKDIVVYTKDKQYDAVKILPDLQQEKNKQIWKQMMKDLRKDFNKVVGTIKMPEFTPYNCHRNIEALKVQGTKLKDEIWDKYLSKYRKMKKSEKSESSDLPYGKSDGYGTPFSLNSLLPVQAHAREEYSNSYHDGDVSEEQNATISIYMMSVFLIFLCFMGCGGMISGSIFGYFAHGFIENNRHKYYQQEDDMQF